MASDLVGWLGKGGAETEATARLSHDAVNWWLVQLVELSSDEKIADWHTAGQFAHPA